MPYVLTGGRVIGAHASIAAFETGGRLMSGPATEERATSPAPNAVLTFPAAPGCRKNSDRRGAADRREATLAASHVRRGWKPVTSWNS
jgi:hypothetical protein